MMMMIIITVFIPFSVTICYSDWSKGWAGLDPRPGQICGCPQPPERVWGAYGTSCAISTAGSWGRGFMVATLS